MIAAELAKALGGRRVGRGWSARCPAHDDQNPSLAIRDAAGKPLIRCHAGCSQQAVLSALKSRGLWDCAQRSFSRVVSSANRHAMRSAAARAGYEREQHAKALALWMRRQPAPGSPVETYLRQARGFRGTIPATIGYLPASRGYKPTMICAFGLADGPAPDALSIRHEAIRGVHLTALSRDGLGTA
jgi:hypothetical protein